MKTLNRKKRKAGVDNAQDPPVPMPNTEVKLSGAENTWVATPREDREMPALSFNIPPVANAKEASRYSSSSQCVAFGGKGQLNIPP